MAQEPTWIVICGVGVQCNRCRARLEVPNELAKWHDMLEKFIKVHSACMRKDEMK